MSSMRFIALTLFTSASICLWPALVVGDDTKRDVVTLDNGGQLVGKVTELEGAKPPVIVVETDDGQTLKIFKSQVKQIDRANEQLDEYLQKKNSMADTVDDHWAMAAWCKEHLEHSIVVGLGSSNSMSPQRRYHLEQILRLDPDNVKARSLLGYSKKNGQWINLEQLRMAHGLVRKNRQWLTPEEVYILDAKEAWFKKADSWSGQLKRLTTRSNVGLADAIKSIREIQDPTAVSPLVEMINSDVDLQIKLACVEALGAMPNRVATRELSDLSVIHPDESVRERCLVQLKLDGVDRQAVANHLNSYLNSTNNDVINRAGFVLGELGQVSSILPLIKSLVTTHLFKNPAAGNPGQIAPMFGHDSNGNTFGGLGVGSKQPATFKKDLQNRGVREALQKITGNDYEFNASRWLDWYTKSQTLGNVDLRRDE